MGLPEQARCGIPWAICSTPQPPEFRVKGKEYPHWLTQGSCQMGSDRINRDHKIKLCNQSSRVREIIQGCSKIDNRWVCFKTDAIVLQHIFLKRMPFYFRAHQWQKQLERNIASGIHIARVP